MNKNADSTTQFKVLDTKPFVKRIRAHPSILLVHNETEQRGPTALQDETRNQDVHFHDRSTVFSIDNAVLGTVPKRLLFKTLRNTDYLGSVDTNPFKFRRDLNYFWLFVKGKLP
jgi:hypothetical protein